MIKNNLFDFNQLKIVKNLYKLIYNIFNNNKYKLEINEIYISFK